METEPLEILLNNDRINITGEGPNTVINFRIKNSDLKKNDLKKSRFIFKGSSGSIENLTFIFKNNPDNSGNLNFLEFRGCDRVFIKNVNIKIIGDDIDIIKIISCTNSNFPLGADNTLDNLNIEAQYLENNNSLRGVVLKNSNHIELNKININIFKQEQKKDPDLELNEKKINKILECIHLNNTVINAKNVNLELKTEYKNNSIIKISKSKGPIPSLQNSLISGDKLILISENSLNNFVIKNDSENKILVMNCNILGDFSGKGIFSSGGISIFDKKFFSYQTSLLSNKDYNILIGNNAGENTMGKKEQQDNIFIGKNSGNLLEKGTDNLFIGNESGSKNKNCNQNVLIGNHVGKYLKNNTMQTVMIGFKSGFTKDNKDNNKVGKNVFLGSFSGCEIIGENNTILGNQNENIITKNIKNNIFVGSNSGINSNGSNNILIGNEIQNKDIPNKKIKNLNIHIGNRDIQTLDSDANINIGHNITDKKGSSNINIGNNAGGLSKNGNNNMNIGFQTGYQKNDKSEENSNDRENIIIGNKSGNKIQNNSNIVLGFHSFQGGRDSQNNTIIGNKSGSNLNSKNNIFLGNNICSKETNKGDDNICIGYSAGEKMGTIEKGSDNNILIGNFSGSNSINTTNNIFLGHSAGKNTKCLNTIIIGNDAGNESKVSTDNYEGCILLGNESGKKAQNLKGDVLIGHNTGVDIKGNMNTIIGFDSGQRFGSKNTVIGYKSASLATGNNNTVIGHASGGNISNGNVIIGDGISIYDKDLTSNKLNECVIIGSQSSQKAKLGEGSVIIGYGTGQNKGNRNTLIGYKIQSVNNEVENNDNTIIGWQAGIKLNGNSNLLVGSKILLDSMEKNNINNNIILGNLSAPNNYVYNNLFIVGNNSGNKIGNINTNRYYEDSETMIIGNSSGNGIKKNIGNLILGNKVGEYLEYGYNNTLIGDKIGFNLNKGSDNLFIGNSKTLIYKTEDGRHDVPNSNLVLYPSVIVGNESGFIEILKSYNLTDDNKNKVRGILSKTTYRNKKVLLNLESNEFFITQNSNKFPLFLVELNNLNKYPFIRNFDGNNWGMYEKNIDIKHSKLNFHNKWPIIFSPDDILEIEYISKISKGKKILKVRVVAIIQTIRETKNFIDKDIIIKNISLNDERIYFDLLEGELEGEIINSKLSIKSYTSSNYYNKEGCNNVSIGSKSGNFNISSDNVFIGSKSGKNSYIGINNTLIGSCSGESLGDGSNNTIIGCQAGKFMSSSGNIAIGNKCLENSKNVSNNIVIGEESNQNLQKGYNNVLVGHRTGIELKESNNNILLGNNCLNFNNKANNKANKANNNIILGNNIISNQEINDKIIIGNNNLTTIRDIIEFEDELTLYIPVENGLIFGIDELYKIYSLANPIEYNYINTNANPHIYPRKSIIHRFPVGKTIITRQEPFTERELRIKLIDNSNSLKYIDLDVDVDDTNKPFITLKILGENNDNNNIFQGVYSVNEINKNDNYMILIKKSIIDTSLINTHLVKLKNSSIEINNNICILNIDGRHFEDETGNITPIFKEKLGMKIIELKPEMIIEKVVNLIINGDNLDINDNVLTLSNPKNVFKIGDKVNILSKNKKITEANYDKITGFIISSINDNEIKFDKNNVKFKDIFTMRPRVVRIILAQENKKRNIIFGNLNNNKLLFNGNDKDLSTQITTTHINGSLGIKDFLLLEKTEGTLQRGIKLTENQSIIWLENGDMEHVPKLKMKYNKKIWTINMECDE